MGMDGVIQDSAATALEFRTRGLLERTRSAVARRARRVWQRWTQGSRRPAVEAALDWLRHDCCRSSSGEVPNAPLSDPRLRHTLLHFIADEGSLQCEGRLKWEGVLNGEGEAPAQPHFASRALHDALARQRFDGALPLSDTSSIAGCADTARFALACFRPGYTTAGQRAMEWLRHVQTVDGSWPESVDLRCGQPLGGPSREAAIEFLAAQRAEVTSVLIRLPSQGLPSISADDGRLRAVNEWFAGLRHRVCIVDVGCGSARYLRTLNAGLRIGIDPARSMLSKLPDDVTAVAGCLPRLPLRSGTCDGALCVETLEHSLAPREAVAELCRIVRPGGSVLIVDKHTAFQGLSECHPWERWFEPEEVSGWLAPFCRRIDARPIAHGPHRSPTGLFWSWTAVRRA